MRKSGKTEGKEGERDERLGKKRGKGEASFI